MANQMFFTSPGTGPQQATPRQESAIANTAGSAPIPRSGMSGDVFALVNPPVGRDSPPVIPPEITPIKINGKDGLRIRFRDLRGGLNKQIGDLPQDATRTSRSSLDHRYPGTLCLPPLTGQSATPDPSDTSGTGANAAESWFYSAMFAARPFNANTLAVAICSAGAGGSLFKETSSTDPTIIDTSLSLTATSNYMISMNAVNDELVIGYANNLPLKAYTDLASPPTVGSTGSASTNDTWGVIEVPIPASTGTGNAALVHAGNTLYYHDTAGSTAWNTDYTDTGTNLPQGGYALGCLALGGRPLRAYWVVPHGATLGITQSVVRRGAEYKSKIVSTNIEGGDPQQLGLAIPYCYYAALHPDGIVYSDGRSDYFHNGRRNFNLNSFSDRPANSDQPIYTRGFYVAGRRLLAERNTVPFKIANTDGTGYTTAFITQRWVEEYDFDLDAWNTVSEVINLASWAANIIAKGLTLATAGPSMPVSLDSGNLICYADGTWYTLPLAPQGINPYSLRKTAGATATSGATYASTGWTETPRLYLGGRPAFVRAIELESPPDNGGAGGTPATTQFQIGSNTNSGTNVVSHTFQTGEPDRVLRHEFKANSSPIYWLQVRVTATRQSGGTDPTRYTQNCLPFVVEIEFADAKRTDPMRG